MRLNKSFIFILLTVITLSTTSCSNGCDGEQPSARIINNGNEKASVQIKTSGGNTVNINNVDPQTSSEYSSYAPGSVTFTITVKDVNYEKTVDLGTCIDYDIAIDENNVITSIATPRD